MKRNRSPRRRHGLALRAAHRGLTLLEIMIVIAILGLVMGLVVVPRVMDMFADSQEKIAKLAVNQLAGKDYAQWSMATNKTCPESLLVIVKHAGRGEQDTVDPWETPYKFFCKENLPPGANSSFAVMSAGPDKKEGTEDDIKSWEPLKKK